MPRTLTDEDALFIAQKTAELLQRPLYETTDILTLAEARRFVKKKSVGAFYEWCHRWYVQPTGHGRYSRARLNLALEREAGTAHTPAAIKRIQQQLGRISGT